MAATYSDFSEQGWKDYRQGISYPAAYDTWSEKDQRNYENGRMRAANYKLATGNLPHTHVAKLRYAAATMNIGPAFYDSRDPLTSIPKMSDSRQRAVAS